MNYQEEGKGEGKFKKNSFFFLYFRRKIKMKRGFLKRRIESGREFFSKVFENRIIGERARGKENLRKILFFFFILEER